MNFLRKLVRHLGSPRFCGSYNVAVNVAGSACLRVSKVFRDNHQWSSIRDQEAGVSVPEWMDAAREETGLSGKLV